MGRTKTKTARFPLSWHAARGGYKKMIQGKIYYFALGKCDGPNDAAGRQQALIEYGQLLSELNGETPPKAAPPTPPGGRVLEFELEATPTAPTRHQPPVEPPAASMATDYERLLPKGDELPHVGAAIATDDLESLIELYCEEKRRAAERGSIAVTSYNEHCYLLDDFKTFALRYERTKIHQIDNQFLKSYKGLQEYLCNPKSDLPKADRIGSALAKKRLQFARRFMEWCVEQEVIEAVPAAMGRKYASIALPRQKPKFWTPAEIHSLLDNAHLQPFGRKQGLLRLSILLGLNCGYLPSCIASLRHDDVDWDFGIIDRERSKTGMLQVSKLWPETLTHLRDHATKRNDDERGGGLVLIGAKYGSPLVHERIKDDGKITRTDTISRAFGNLRRKHLEWPSDGRSFKTLRKSAAETLSAEFQSEPAIVDKFLAHGIKRITSHYISGGHFDRLFQATDWLREKLEIAKHCK